MADLDSKLDAIVAEVSSARSMPLSASCVVNRAELLEQLEEIRGLLPKEVIAAKQVMSGKDEVLAEARAEAEGIIEEARAERARMVARTEIVQGAQKEATRLLDEARETGETMRREVDDYVDSKLANFEVVLQKTLAAVDRGREKMRGRSELDDLATEEPGGAGELDELDEVIPKA